MTTQGSGGSYDDKAFSDDELLYRRVPDQPKFLQSVDPVTGARRPTIASFSISGDPDGLSVSIHSLIRRHGLKTFNLCNWDTHGVARFQARHVRPDLGLVADETDDPLIGKAHGLIRGPEGKPSKSVWNRVRDEILENVVYFDSDPGLGSDK